MKIKKFIYNRVEITVKEIQFKKNIQERYFIYYPGFYQGIAGGSGWKDLVELYKRFMWWKKKEDNKFNHLINEFKNIPIDQVEF